MCKCADLFKRCPEPMYEALTLHNNVIRRAKYANCGSTVQQEGDSYTLVSKGGLHHLQALKRAVLNQACVAALAARCWLRACATAMAPAFFV